MKTFAFLTGGGDCPGLNPAIYGATITALKSGHKVLGIIEGWKGMIDGNHIELDRKAIEDIVGRGGTMLGTSRTNPFKRDGGSEAVKDTFQRLGINGLIAAGGEDTLGVASKLFDMGLPVVGVPKTMDNDLSGTDSTFGFDSAATVAMDAAMRLRDTARSHRRAIVLEVMGRHAGWVALYTGLSAYADYTMIPERRWSWDEICEKVKKAHKDRSYALIIVSEGVELGQVQQALDEFGHVNLAQRDVGEALAQEIGKLTGIETRSAKLGHIERGGPPTLFDRVLGIRVGVSAMRWLMANEYGFMAALRGENIVKVPLKEAVGALKIVTKDWIELLEVQE